MLQTSKWENRGSDCKKVLRACTFSFGPQENWAFSGHIKYPPGSTTLGGGLPIEIYFNVSFRFTQCSGACVNNFADLYRFDTNDIASESDRTDKEYYIDSPFFGPGTEMTTSRLDQTGHRKEVFETSALVINSTSSRTNGFHFGIRDTVNCGQINRMYTSSTHLVRNDKMDWSTILSLFVPPTALNQTWAWLAVLPTLTPPPLSPSELTVPAMEHVNAM